MTSFDWEDRIRYSFAGRAFRIRLFICAPLVHCGIKLPLSQSVRCRTRLRNQPADRTQQDFHVYDGFRNVLVKTRFQIFFTVAGHSVCRNGYNAYVAEPFILTDSVDDLDAGPLVEANVHDDEVGHISIELAQGLDATVTAGDF